MVVVRIGACSRPKVYLLKDFQHFPNADTIEIRSLDCQDVLQHMYYGVAHVNCSCWYEREMEIKLDRSGGLTHTAERHFVCTVALGGPSGGIDERNAPTAVGLDPEKPLYVCTHK
jgi:hypothetical protein